MRQIHPEYVIGSEGKPRRVLLDVDEFEELIECVEDILDVAEIEGLRQAPRSS